MSHSELLIVLCTASGCSVFALAMLRSLQHLLRTTPLAGGLENAWGSQLRGFASRALQSQENRCVAGPDDCGHSQVHEALPISRTVD